MASQVSITPEARKIAVKTKPIQVDLTGKEVKEAIANKICPLLASPCIKGECIWWTKTRLTTILEGCAIVITAVLMEAKP